MLKKIGFVAVLIGIMVALRPQLFLDLFRSKNTDLTAVSDSTQRSATTDSTEIKRNKAEELEAYYSDRNNPTLLAKNNKATEKNTVVSEEGITEYAEGYGPKDFGKAFEPEGLPSGSEGQPSPGGIWDDLLNLKFKIEYDESIDDVVFKPQFTEAIRRHAGKTVDIKGYIIPSEIVAGAMGGTRAGMFMFSAFPNQSCFFCGGAGPESVIEAYPKKPIPYSKESVTIRGRLELNDTDFLRMAYILKDAQLVE